MADEKTKIEIGLVMEQTKIESDGQEIQTKRTVDYHEVSEVLYQVQEALKDAIENDQIISFSAEIVPAL